MFVHHNGTKMHIYREFEALRRRAFYHRLWCGLTDQRHQLLDLEQVQKQGAAQRRRHGGIQLVTIAQICGSEGRSQDFDANFCPLKPHSRERWVNIVLARQADVTLPLVELIQIGDCYFVRDGHHRISVAKAQGQLEIEAEVICWAAPLPNLATAPRQPDRAKQGWRTVGQLFASLIINLTARFMPATKLAALPQRT